MKMPKSVEDRHSSDETVVETLGLIGPKWTIPILVRLRNAGAPTRYSALRRALSDITSKELAKHLHKLQSAALIERNVIETSPPTVEYWLTARGRRFLRSLSSATVWKNLAPQTK